MRVLAALLLLLAACSGDGPTTETTVRPTTSSVTTSTLGVSTTIPPFVEVPVDLSPDGTHLVDQDGRSLYMFTLDTERTSSCEGACAEAWPPLLGDPVAGEGVDQELLGNSERDNGAIQVTYGGQPLYTYSGDSEPGDTNGHGFNDVWFLVAPDGTAIGS